MNELSKVLLNRPHRNARLHQRPSLQCPKLREGALSPCACNRSVPIPNGALTKSVPGHGQGRSEIDSICASDSLTAFPGEVRDVIWSIAISTARVIERKATTETDRIEALPSSSPHEALATRPVRRDVPPACSKLVTSLYERIGLCTVPGFLIALFKCAHRCGGADDTSLQIRAF